MAGQLRVEWCALSEPGLREPALSERSESKGKASRRPERVEGHSLPFVYIAGCSDDSLDVGHTDDLAVREHTHNQGHGARYTATRRPVRIIYSEHFPSIKDAVTRERQLKGWTNPKKEALVRHDAARLKGISSRSRKSRSA